MVRLIDDLLDVSRISRDNLELRRERVTLASVLERALETSQPLLDANEHEFSLALPADPIWLDADPVRLAQVFSNLFNNAANYTECGGRIRVVAERNEGQVTVRVQDNGIGIAPEHIPHLFEIFAQGPPEVKRLHGGLGIGLSLVRGLVNLHGGSVTAQSAGPGKGSEFRVCLPIASPPAGRDGPARCNEDLRATANSRVLVADDNHDCADSLAMLLQLAGYETRTAYDGAEAIAMAESYRPDILLLDIGMPNLNGHEAARHIRDQPWGKDLLLVALTGWGQEEDRRRTEAAGFDAHFVKPVDSAALEQVLADFDATGRRPA